MQSEQENVLFWGLRLLVIGIAVMPKGEMWLKVRKTSKILGFHKFSWTFGNSNDNSSSTKRLKLEKLWRFTAKTSNFSLQKPLKTSPKPSLPNVTALIPLAPLQHHGKGVGDDEKSEAHFGYIFNFDSFWVLTTQRGWAMAEVLFRTDEGGAKI
jgi:hypothetical protein